MDEGTTLLTCTGCGREVATEDATDTLDGGVVCDECWEEGR